MDSENLNGEKADADAIIHQAAKQLEKGEVVAFPTETVYGLGADATNPHAIENIFRIKQRPPDHPLIVHIQGPEDLPIWSSKVCNAAYALAERFWPGPLTLILPESRAHPSITGGQTSVGLRTPRHPVALKLLKSFGRGIAAPSANRFGRISPTRADHVRAEFGNVIDLILEGGDCEVGLESTILSLVSDRPTILRPGTLTRQELEDFLKTPIESATPTQGLRASGLLESHYAPSTPLRLVSRDELLHLKPKNPQKTVVMRLGRPSQPSPMFEVPMPENSRDYGKALYATLRQLDQRRFEQMLVETPPAEEEWIAVLDRLTRASHESMNGAEPTHSRKVIR